MLFVADILKIMAMLWGCYNSYKLLRDENRTADNTSAMLQFWCLLAFLSIYESIVEPLVSWFPMYSLAKAGIIFFVLAPNSNVLETSNLMFKRVVTPVMENIHKHSIRTALPLSSAFLTRAVQLSVKLYLRVFADSLTRQETEGWHRLMEAHADVIREAREAAEARRKEEEAGEGSSATSNIPAGQATK